MEIVVYVGGALLFFALVMASVALHEVGHLVPAKLFGIKATQYFVGFGRTLWSTRRGETEYGVKLLPLGGYVKMVGMLPPGKHGEMRNSSTGLFAQIIDGAREAEWEDITPEDDGRLFHQKPPWQKLIVMAGGPIVNVILAFVLLLAVGVTYGNPRSTLVVNTVSECIVPADQADRACAPGDPATPAKAAGLQPGDRLVSMNGVTLTDWDQTSELIRRNLDQEMVLVVERDGQTQELRTTTVITGVADRVDPKKRVQAGFLGVSPVVELQRGGPVETLQDMGSMTQTVFHTIIRFPVRVYQVAADLVTGQPRDVNGPMSIVGASRVAGEIASTDKIASPDKVATFVSTLGAVNLFLALFNFVPLLPLDGGHIAGALWEWLRRGLARLTKRPDPGPVDTAKMMPVAYVMAAVIGLSGLVLIVADIIDPVRLF